MSLHPFFFPSRNTDPAFASSILIGIGFVITRKKWRSLPGEFGVDGVSQILVQDTFSCLDVLVASYLSLSALDISRL